MALGGNRTELVVDLTFDNSKAAAALQTQLSGITRQTQNFNKNPIIAKNFTQPLGQITGSADEFTKSLAASNARVLAFGASAGAIFAVQKAMSELVKTTISVEQALTDINALLGASNKDFKKFSDGLFNVARKTGTAFAEVAESANEFARQGLSVEDTLKRTNAALALSKLGMMDSVNATESLTAALNTFKGEVNDAEVVVNKLAQVDAKFAVSSKDLAEAIKRTGSSASDASVSFNELLAAVTVTQERTARGGAVIGNAFKTIFTRIQRPEVLNQLKRIGVDVKDSSGEMLPAIQILKQYGAVYDSLSPALRSTTAQLIAGGRQINILKALMPELASGTGKFDAALKVANETTTEATDRLKILTSTTQGTLNAVTANLTKTASEIGQLTIAPAINNILKGLDRITTLVGPSNFFGLGETIGKGVYEGIGKVLSGPGIILLATILAKLGGNLLSFVKTSGAQFLGLNKQAEEQSRIQTYIGNILMQRPQVMQKILSGQISQNDAAKVFSNELRTAEFHYAKLNDLASSLAAKQRLFKGPSKGGGRAAGLIPNFVPNFAMADVQAEREAASAGGYRAGQIRRMNVPGMGGITYNGKEKVKEFPGMQQPAIMPPALSQAGKDYRGQFKDTIGFDPYNAASGFVPNFAVNRMYKIRGKQYSGQEVSAMIRPTRKKAREFTAAEAVAAGYAPSGTSPKQRAAGMKRMDASDDPREVYSVDLKGMLGLLSLRGQSGGASPRMNLGNLPGIKDTIKNRGLTHLANDQVEFENIAISSLQNGGYQKQGGKATGQNVSNRISNVLASPMARLAKEFHHKILGRNEKFDQTEVAKVLKASKGGFISTSTEGDIFENVVRIVTQNASGGLKETFDQNVSEKEPFDFEEGDRGVTKEFQQFMFPNTPSLRKADAKRTADPKQIRSLIKKAYSSRILNSENSIFSGKFALPGLDEGLKGSGFKADEKDIEKAEKQLKNAIKAEKSDKTLRGKALGLIPNFSLRGISNAIQREDRSGVRRDKVRVGYDRRLAASGGIGVYNTDEGSLGNAIDMHMSAGRNKSQIQRQGKAYGHVPNFATRFDKEVQKKHGELGTKAMGGGRRGRTDKETELGMARDLFTSSTGGGGFKDVAPAMKEIAQTTKEASASIGTNEKVVKKGTETRERGLGALAGMIIVGGQLSSLGSSVEENDNALVSLSGTLLKTGGSLAMYIPTVETALTSLGVKGNSLGEQFMNLRIAAIAAAGSLKNMSISGMLGVGGAAAANRGGLGLRDAMSRGSELGQRSGLGTRKMGKFGGAMSMVGRGGGLLGGAARGLAAAGPYGLAAAAIAAPVLIMNKMQDKKEKEAVDRLQSVSEQAAKRFNQMSEALNKASSSTDNYIKALRSGNKEQIKIARQKVITDLSGANLREFFSNQKNAFTIGAGKSQQKVGDAQTAMSILLDANQEEDTRVELIGRLQAASTSVAKLTNNSNDIALVFSQLAEMDGKYTEEQISKVANLFAQIARSQGMTSEELGVLGRSIRGVNKTAVELDDQWSVYGSEFDRLSGGFKGLFKTLKLEAGAHDNLAITLDTMSDKLDDEAATEFFVKLLPLLADSTKRLREGMDDANAALKKTTDAENARAIRENQSTRDLIKKQTLNFKNFSAETAQASRMLNTLKKFEVERFKLVTSSESKILSKLSTEFANARRSSAREAGLVDIQEDASRKLAVEKEQKNNLETVKKFMEATDAQSANQNNVVNTPVSELNNQLKKLIQQGATGDTLAQAVDRIANADEKSGGFGSQFDPSDPASKISKALVDLKDSLKKGSDDLRIQNQELEQQYDEQRAVNKLKLKLELTAIRENQKIKFGSGIFETPQGTLNKFVSAEENIISGRRTGDADLLTKGLIDQAKLVQGFEFGDQNPAEQLTQQLADQFQQNAIKFAEMRGISLTQAQKDDLRPQALAKAQAITKDSRQVNIELTSVTEKLIAVQNSSVNAITLNSELLDKLNNNYNETFGSGEEPEAGSTRAHQSKGNTDREAEEREAAKIAAAASRKKVTKKQLENAINMATAVTDLDSVIKKLSVQLTKSEGDKKKNPILNFFDEFKGIVGEGLKQPLQPAAADPFVKQGEAMAQGFLEMLNKRFPGAPSYDEKFGPDAGKPLPPGGSFTPSFKDPRIDRDQGGQTFNSQGVSGLRGSGTNKPTPPPSHPNRLSLMQKFMGLPDKPGVYKRPPRQKTNLGMDNPFQNLRGGGGLFKTPFLFQGKDTPKKEPKKLKGSFLKRLRGLIFFAEQELPKLEQILDGGTQFASGMPFRTMADVPGAAGILNPGGAQAAAETKPDASFTIEAFASEISSALAKQLANLRDIFRKQDDYKVPTDGDAGAKAMGEGASAATQMASFGTQAGARLGKGSLPIAKLVTTMLNSVDDSARQSLALGIDSIDVNTRRNEMLEKIKAAEEQGIARTSVVLKNEVDKYLLNEKLIQSLNTANEAQRRFNANLITTADLITQRDTALANSYHDADKNAKALNESIGARFTYNSTTFRKQSSELVVGMVDDFKSGTKQAFGEAIRGTATLREAFSKVFDNLLDKALDQSLNMGVDAIFGAAGAAFGVGKAKGGRIKGYNAGGFVNQGSGVRDDVPAMMQGGEYVIRKSSVNKYGRGMFDALNSGGRVGYAMGDRIMQNRLRPEFVYNDPKRPTSGSFINTGGLSAFAMMESGSPMIGIQQEREKALESYIKDKAAYDAMVQKAKDNFKKQQKARMKETLISVGLQAAAFGIGQMMPSSLGAAGRGGAAQGAGGRLQGVKGLEGLDVQNFSLPDTNANALRFGSKGGMLTNNGFVKGFARGGRNRDNIPAMLMGGEYVVNKRSVDKYGVGLFNDLNNGRARGFANGGMVGGDGGGTGGAPTTANNNFEINISMTGGGESETTTSSNQNENQSQEDQERNEQLGMAVKNAVQTELIEQQRPGGLLYREDRI